MQQPERQEHMTSQKQPTPQSQDVLDEGSMPFKTTDNTYLKLRPLRLLYRRLRKSQNSFLLCRMPSSRTTRETRHTRLFALCFLFFQYYAL